MKLSLRCLSFLLTGATFVLFASVSLHCSPPDGSLPSSGGHGGDTNPGSGEGGSSGNGGASGSGGNSVNSSGGSTTSSGGNETGGAVGSGGSTTSSGGSSGTGGKSGGTGGKSGSGGSSATSNGGSGSGGVQSSGGATTTPASGGTTGVASCTTDLMTLRNGTDNNWIASTPNSCGVQGSVYAYGDGTTCTKPSPISATACTTTSCCISGTTTIDTAGKLWGCGLGVDLNSSGGASATKSAYAGTAKGFKVTITGTVAPGQKIRIMYGSAATDPAGGTAPYKEVAGVGVYSVLFSDATCPDWATGSKCAKVTGSAAYSLKVQIVEGAATGDAVGAFSDVCITKIEPL